MSFADKVMEGNARIGNFNYRIMGKLFRVLTRRMDKKRLKTQDYDYSDIETKTYSYMEDKNPYHQFDIHQRKDGYHHKGIIISIHGGGLIYGDKDLNRNSIKDLARMGYIVLSPSYSLAPKKSLYEQIHELFTFFQYIIDNRNKLSLILENVFLIGDSAGGLLSLYCVSISNSPSLQQAFDITQGMILPFRAITLISTMSKLENTFIKRLAIKKADKNEDGIVDDSELKELAELIREKSPMLPFYINRVLGVQQGVGPGFGGPNGFGRPGFGGGNWGRPGGEDQPTPRPRGPVDFGF